MKLAALLLIGALAGLGQEGIPGLPPDAFVVETARVPESVKKDRLIVLWMINPEKPEKLDIEDDRWVGCSAWSRGIPYRGRTRLSLADTKANRIVNTIEVRSSDEDTFDIPAVVFPGYYTVPKIGANKAGKPRVLDLRDVNGDGKLLEFALFDQQACMGLATALFGYSEKQDKLIQYAVDLTFLDGLRHREAVEMWPDYLFATKPVAPGRWRHAIDYSGRGGCVESYELKYSEFAERFTGTLTLSNCAKEHQD